MKSAGKSQSVLTVIARESTPAGLRRDLGAVDFTLLVIGAVIGADVYIVAALGARFLGPAQLLAWLAGGVLAAIILLAFVQCSVITPKVGGTYAYVRDAFGPLAGFMAGWALYLGEWVALPIFPAAFANYLTYFIPGLSGTGRLATEVGLIAVVTGINIFGVRASGRLNDLLTLAKLLPLAVLIMAALAVVVLHPGSVTGHLVPFAPLGWSGFGPALLLIFWAYAGFELAVLPATEVKSPSRTLPRGLIVGMAVATLFYLLTSVAVVIGLPWQVAANSSHPLADALSGLSTELGLPTNVGSILMALGGLVSIGAVYDVFTLSVARLGYAMAADGVLPRPLAKIHPRFGTPIAALLVQAASALFVGWFLDLMHLIDIAMFFLGLCYLATGLAALRLVSSDPERRLPVPGLRFWLTLASIGGLYLSSQAPPELIGVGVAAMAVGLALYALRVRTGRQIVLLGHTISNEEQRLLHWAREHEAWLLRSVRRLFPP